MEEKLSAVAGKTEVMFLMPGEDLAEAKKNQRYGNDLPDDAKLLVVTFRSSQDD